MAERIVVGAGLAGLTAAINLRRRGHEVRVLERRDGVGGPSRDLPTGDLSYTMGDGSPVELDKLHRYTGIDIAPACLPLPGIRVYSFGKRYDIAFPPNVPAFLVERGPRDSSLDMHLYRIAVGEGVRFEFNFPLRTRKDFQVLPPGTILATGIFPEAYHALDLPFVPGYGLFGQGRVAEGYIGPQVIIYMDRHTWDYAFFSTINGTAGALLFQRKRPLSEEAKRWFPSRLARDEGIELSEWYDVEDFGGEKELLPLLPLGSIANPRLFHGKFILAGTLSGAQDPVLLFGIHGALVTGTIAAMAAEEPERAQAEFRRVIRFWRSNYLGRLVVEATHPWGLMVGSRLGLELYRYYAPFALRYAFLIVPGWLRLKQRQARRWP